MADTSPIVSIEIVGGPKASAPWREGMNAQAALELAWAEISNTQKFTYGLQATAGKPTVKQHLAAIRMLFDC